VTAKKKAAVKKAAATDNTVAKQLEPFHFKPGQSGNPKGRPKGSRNALGEDFLSDMLAVWREKGKDCIEATAKDHPEKLVSIVAGILPKELNVNTNAAEELSDDDLAAGIASLRAIIAAQQAREGSDAETKH
jgi:hypothetical protein